MSIRPPEVIDSAGNRVRLGPALGQGGEGAVYEVAVSPKLVAKIYHKPLSAERAEKIRVMSALRTGTLDALTAWPLDIVRDLATGAPVGLLMPKIVNRRDIHQLYSPKSRRAEFQRADWRFLIRAATNTARAFAAVHEAGCVIGDVNHGGVLVAQDATVTLIDCDSFQVTHAGRRFLCEVGVETFTPPELQGRSFHGIVRTPNHDEFGLAVVVFLLLFMGRHPFAGRYAGPGDMPIARAIEEVRFAYGMKRAAVQMTQPPGTPSLLIVGPRVAVLFERAFARECMSGGRPGAKEWIEALSELENKLRQCSTNPSHWHHEGLQCPWCPMEGATGVPLFPVVVQAAAGTTFDIAQLWRQVEGVAHPGAAPAIAPPVPAPSPEALRHANWSVTRYGSALAAAAAALLSSAIAGPVMILAAGVIFFVVLAALDKSDRVAPYKGAYLAAQAKWFQAEREWAAKAGSALFEERRAGLDKLRREWDQILTLRSAKLQDLHSDRERVQRERFLDRFEIEKARIEGVGKGRKQTLESYGIETAADVTHGNLAKVPGFGPTMQARLLAWRASLEQQFVFDPTQQIDPRDILRVEQQVMARKKELEAKMGAGLAALRQSHAQIMATRQHMRSSVEAVRRDFLQAKADHEAFG